MNLLNLKRKVKRSKNRKGKILKLVTILSIFIFVIGANLTFIFADPMPIEEFTFNDVTYTKWFTQDLESNNRGYVYFGYYPSENFTVANQGQFAYDTLKDIYDEYFSWSISDGGKSNALEKSEIRLDDTVVLDDNNKYILTFKDHIGNKIPSYFKFEPIKWRIIDFDETNHTLTLLSDKEIESRPFDVRTSDETSKIYWGGDGNTDSPNTGKEYPTLRLYLNNYDSSEGYGDGSNNHQSFSKTNFVYTEKNITTPFYDRGFLEKAFTASDRAKMVGTKVKSYNANDDGASITSVNDKVRLLTKSEVQDSTSPFGFTSDESRIAYSTGYAKGGKGTVMSKDGYHDSTNNMHHWYTSSQTTGTGYIISVLYTGTFEDPFPNNGSRNAQGGVRPVIQIKLDDLTKVSGDGSFENPYSFANKLKITTNDITGTDIAYYTPGQNQISFDIIPGNTINGIYTSKDKTTRLDSPEAPGIFTMPNSDYEVYVDVNVTSENAYKLLSSLDEGGNYDGHYVYQAVLNDSYIDVIDAASTTYDISGIKSLTPDQRYDIAYNLYWNINDNDGPYETLAEYEEYLYKMYYVLYVPFDDKYDMNDINNWWDVSYYKPFSTFAYLFYDKENPDKYGGRKIVVRDLDWGDGASHTLDYYCWNTSLYTIKSIEFYNSVKINPDNDRPFLFDNENIEKADLTNLDSSEVQNMNFYFACCQNLKEINFANFDTSNVTNIAGMFAFDESLTNLDLSSFKIKEGTITSGDYSSIDPEWTNVSVFDGCTNLNTIKLPATLGEGVDIPLPGSDTWYIYDADFNQIGTATKLIASESNGACYVSTTIPFNLATNDNQMKNLIIQYKDELNATTLLDGKSEEVISLVANYVFKKMPSEGYASNNDIKTNIEFALNHIPTLALTSDKSELDSGENVILTSTLTCESEILNLFKEHNLMKKGTPSSLVVKNGTFPYTLNYSQSVFGTYYQEYLLDTSITSNPFTLKSNEVTISKKNTGGGSGSGGGGGSSGGSGGSSGGSKNPEPITPAPVTEEVLHSSYINGYEDKTFLPNQNITRAEFCKIISSILGGYEQLSTDEIDKTLMIFSDVKTKWYRPYIAHLVKLNVLDGYEDGTFKPNKNITRGEASKILSLTFDIKENNIENNFTEEIKNEWFFEYVDKLVKAGLINGYDDGTFKGNRSISRAETVALVNRTTNREITLNIPKTIKNPFIDVYENDWFYKDIIEASVSHKETELHDVKVQDNK